MWLGHKPLPEFPEFPGRLGDKQPHLMTIPILPSSTRLILNRGLPNLEEACISPLLLPSAVCSRELQESAAGHRHLHAHSDGDLHPDQRGLLHHPPHQFDLGQWCRGSGKCMWSLTCYLTLALQVQLFTVRTSPSRRLRTRCLAWWTGPFPLPWLFPVSEDSTPPSWRPPGERLQLDICFSVTLLQHLLPGCRSSLLCCMFFVSKKAVLRGLQRGPPAWLPVHDPCHPLHSHPRPALQRQSTPIIFYPLILPSGIYVLHI